MTEGPATTADGAHDSALVARVLDGDREAFAEVYDRYADRLYPDTGTGAGAAGACRARAGAGLIH